MFVHWPATNASTDELIISTRIYPSEVLDEGASFAGPRSNSILRVLTIPFLECELQCPPPTGVCEGAPGFASTMDGLAGPHNLLSLRMYSLVCPVSLRRCDLALRRAPIYEGYCVFVVGSIWDFSPDPLEKRHRSGILLTICYLEVSIFRTVHASGVYIRLLAPPV
jgi:hypothetical protein